MWSGKVELYSQELVHMPILNHARAATPFLTARKTIQHSTAPF